MSKPSLEGEEPVRDEFLPFAQPSISEEEIHGVEEVLKSGWLTSGPKVEEFESEFEDFTKTNHAIATNSCTAALHISLLALGIGEGDEVITTPFTFTATGQVISYVGAKPVLADIKKDTFNIDPKKIREKINDRTKAIIPVHYGGQPCNMDSILEIADENDLYIVGDAAHAVGAKYKDRKIGSIGDTTCFSFYAIKNMTTGEGGMVTTDNDDLADSLRKFSYFGIDENAWKRYQEKGKWYYEVKRLGYKYNMTDFQAALGLAQIKKIKEFNQTRRRYASYFTEKLEKFPEIKIPKVKENSTHAWHLYPILLKTENLEIDRSEFIEALEAENIGTSVHFIPIHHHPYYQKEYNFKEGDFPVSNYVYERVVSLPLYPKLTKKDLDDVIRATEKILEYYRK